MPNEKEYTKMDKFDLITQCIKKDSLIDRLQWKLNCEKEARKEDESENG